MRGGAGGGVIGESARDRRLRERREARNRKKAAATAGGMQAIRPGANAGSYDERQARKAQYEANLAKQRAQVFEGGAPVRGMAGGAPGGGGGKPMNARERAYHASMMMLPMGL